MEDTVTFRPRDFSYTTFADMRKEDQFCDLMIRVGYDLVRAHRVIVAGIIPYFKNVLTSYEVKSEDVQFYADDLDLTALETLIDFAYSGEVTISTENVRSLLKASQFLLLNQVQDVCVEFLTGRLRIDNVIEIRTLGKNLSNLNLVTNCDLYIGKNFEEFSKCDDYFSLPHSYIKEIISQDDLNVPTEEIVLRAVVNWVKASPSDRHPVLPDLLSEVRMIYLPTECLMNLVLSEELIASSIPCRDLTDEAKNYHLSKGQSVVTNLKTEPRESTTRKNDPARNCSSVTTTSKDEIYAAKWDCSKNISVYYCDFVHKKWDKVANMKVNDYFSFATATNEKIYMFLKRTILTFHPKTDKWDVLESRHEDIEAFTVVFHENVIYCFYQSSGDSVKMRCFDTERNKWLERERIMDRKCSAAASSGDYIYVTGGYVMNTDLSAVSNVEKYNPSINRWSEVSSMLTPKYSHGCTTLNQKIYVCGGLKTTSGNSVVSSKAEVYDPLTDQWNFISSMKVGRKNVSLVSCNSKIYAVGGYNYSSSTPNSEAYDPEVKMWETSFSVPYSFSSVVAVPAVLN